MQYYKMFCIYFIERYEVWGEEMYQRIRDLREDRDLHQQDLAQMLNCTQACYSNYENGKRDIPTEILIQLADFYNVSVDYILNRTNQKTPYPKK